MRNWVKNIKGLFPVPAMDGESGDDGAGDGAGAGGDSGGTGITPEQFKAIQDENARLKNHHQTLMDETKAAKKALKEIQDKLAEEDHNKAAGSGDIAALNESWQKKFDSKMNELTETHASEKASLESLLKQATVENTARMLAADLALPGSEQVLIPHITPRLEMKVEDGKIAVVVKGVDGRPSALTLDELKAELKSVSAFAPILKGVKGSGSGAQGSDGGADKNALKRSAFEAMSPTDQMKHIQSGGTVTD